jgi:hypothetical protein
MSALEHALAYAARGWRVAPIPRGKKHPGRDDWQLIATTDPATITAWWTQPGAWRDRDDPSTYGVCIVTGAESGVFAVDIDPDHDGDDSLRALEARHGALPDTVEAVTGGGGRHLLFRWPDAGEVRGSASGALGVGIDVRGVGGQIVAAPTIHPDTGVAYAWELEHDPLDAYPVAEAPGWLLEELTKPREVRAPRQPKPTAIGLDPAPGERWAAAHSWPEVLTADGWTLHSVHHDSAGEYYELWTRPGKGIDDGASASLYYGGSDLLKVFTSSAAPLRAELTYTLWGYWVATRFHDDFKRAASTVRAELNKSTILESPPSPSPTPIGMPAASPPPRVRPPVFVNARDLAEVTAEITRHLHDANDPPTLFVRSGKPVRVRADEHHRPMIETVGPDHLALHAAQAMAFVRSGRPTKDDPNPPPVKSTPPLQIIQGVLARRSWPFPPLVGITETPVLRPDGTFHTDHGHDTATHLYHWAHGRDRVHVPDRPDAGELAASIALVDDMLCDFPFATTADRANTWALMLTPIVRPIIGLAPLALLDAPQPASGKSLLAAVTTIVATGRPAAMQPLAGNDEELEKRITTLLMAGATTIAFDNVEGTIRSPVLASALTTDTWQGRVLGRNQNVEVPNRVTWLATGNNIDVGGDMARRCYRIRLEPAGAAEGRTFKHTPLAPWVTGNREQLVGALCTIVRSWWVAGRPPSPRPMKLDSFDQWATVIGGVLAHAGVVGFLENQSEFRRRADREANGWEGFLAAWLELYGPDRIVTVGDLLANLEASDSLLRPALPDDLEAHWDPKGTKGFKSRLGKALAKRVGRHFGREGLHIVEMPKDRTRQARYSVASWSVPRSELIERETSARPDDAARRDAASAEVAEVSPPTPCGDSENGTLWEMGGKTSATSAPPRADEDAAMVAEFWGDR